MNEICFSNFSFKDNGFECDVKSSLRENSEGLYFFMNTDIYFSTDTVAYVLCTLCGNTYNNVFIELDITQEALDNIRNFTHADWHCEKIIFQKKFFGKRTYSVKNPILLNFSGGFDSLAMINLVRKENQVLVAVDFGGWFERETVFFKRFSPNILSTNFRKLKYDRESWTFMGVGCLMMAETLSASSFSFGTILDARLNESHDINSFTAPFSYLGLRDNKLVSGLTEFGTALLSICNFGMIINESLESLAATGSEKQFRKFLLTNACKNRFKLNCDINRVDYPKTKHQFGSNDLIDFLLPCFAKYCIIDDFKQYVDVNTLPEEFWVIVTELKMDFYFRLNTDYTEVIDKNLRAYYFEQLAQCDIIPYTYNDWIEFEKVKKFINKYYVKRTEKK